MHYVDTCIAHKRIVSFLIISIQIPISFPLDVVTKSSESGKVTDLGINKMKLLYCYDQVLWDTQKEINVTGAR